MERRCVWCHKNISKSMSGSLGASVVIMLADESYVCENCRGKIPTAYREYIRTHYDAMDMQAYIRYHKAAQEKLRPLFRATSYHQEIAIDSVHGLFALDADGEGNLNEDSLVLSMQNIVELEFAVNSRYEKKERILSSKEVTTYAGGFLSDSYYEDTVEYYWEDVIYNCIRIKMATPEADLMIIREDCEYFDQMVNEKMMDIMKEQSQKCKARSGVVDVSSSLIEKYGDQVKKKIGVADVGECYKEAIRATLKVSEILSPQFLAAHNRAVNFSYNDRKVNGNHFSL